VDIQMATIATEVVAVVAILMATLLKGMFFLSSSFALIDSLALSMLCHQIILARLLRASRKYHRTCSNCLSLVVTLVVVVVVMVAEAVEAATEVAALEAEVVTECPLLAPTSRSRTGI